MIESAFTLICFILIGAGLIPPTLDFTLLKGRKIVSPYLVLLGLTLSGIILGYLSIEMFGQGTVPIYGRILQVGFFEIFLSLIATIGGILVVVASLSGVKDWPTSPSFYSLLALGVLGSYFLISMGDFVLLIGAWALVSIISYVLVGLKKDRASTEAAAKYALMGILASVLIIYGVAIIYGLIGSTDVGTISDLTGNGKFMLLLGSVFLVAAFGFKIGIVPFHGWLPDVYGKAHPTLIAFLTGVMTVAVVGLVVKVLFPLASALGNQWPILIGILSIITMTFGNVVALLQRNVQRMMAYSSVAHVGYILVGATAALSAGRALGLQGIALHLGSYAFAKVGIFVFLAYLLRKGSGLHLNDLKGLGRSMPIVSVAVGIILLNLIGIPPLLGFWSKFYLFTSVIAVSPWIALVAIINSGISVGYYIQPINYMFFKGGSEPPEEKLGDSESITIIAALVLIIVGGLTFPMIAPYLVT
ncbi:hypothetical protein AKJ45_00765 [candidate division MSBL1 archaeon SCGC-AAA261F19]|uniref:NADH:quinone oxidoreductase/Mrp antiporter transmembrane domain-containing protein n=1 Tax=candidate division MSBL1 archaeon SCGC-AAA261F19 TaxID=1698275 RepID=A0A133VB75_9EURY|nr:hypothetical protein AKJ45_00765 [candidate division MSBL1 archaeon SCGC-AAA261F19]